MDARLYAHVAGHANGHTFLPGMMALFTWPAESSGAGVTITGSWDG